MLKLSHKWLSETGQILILCSRSRNSFLLILNHLVHFVLEGTGITDTTPSSFVSYILKEKLREMMQSNSKNKKNSSNSSSTSSTNNNTPVQHMITPSSSLATSDPQTCHVVST